MELKNEKGVMIRVKADSTIGKMLSGLLKNNKGMAALTGTKVIDSELAGDWKLLIKTIVPASASDTLTLVRATDKITEIAGVFPFLELGIDAALQTIQATFSGLVITVTTKASGGTDATDWTGATARLLIVGR